MTDVALPLAVALIAATTLPELSGNVAIAAVCELSALFAVRHRNRPRSRVTTTETAGTFDVLEVRPRQGVRAR